MTKPKRHHWWPLVQSKHWTDTSGLVNVVRSDGTIFRANPLNLGVESELYTRFGPNDEKDAAIEEWFAATIDSPTAELIEHITNRSHWRRRRYDGDAREAATVRELGWLTPGYLDAIPIPPQVRIAAARYIAALLVRHPLYLEKLVNFHKEPELDSKATKNRALDNMLNVFNIYVERLLSSVIMVSWRAGSSEFLYSDGGITVTEPWRPDIPFDLHAPITPDFALEFLPVPNPTHLDEAIVMEAKNQGVARQNRIVLADANRFVFSRQSPQDSFIKKNFGVPAPENIGYRYVNGQLETIYDPTRK